VRILFIIFILVLFTGCAKNPVEEVNEAIDVALTYLSSEKCDEAIKVLENAGAQPSNAIYLQVLASAYACKANFDEIRFIAEDLEDIDPSTPANIFKSISVLSLSDESAADSAEYVAIRTGINLVLNSRSQTERTQKFGARKAGDLGLQGLILSMVNLGKFLNFYGNVDSAGNKGTNSCFIDYNDNRAQLLVGVSTGACTSDTSGHPDLDQTTTAGRRRLCEGLMLITNTIDILDNLDLSSSSTLSVLEDVSDQVNTFKTTAEAQGLGTLINMTSQAECETHLTTPAQLLDLEFLYALVFETGLQ
jgi:hypothetical protein